MKQGGVEHTIYRGNYSIELVDNPLQEQNINNSPWTCRFGTVFMIAYFTELQIQNTRDQIINAKVNEVNVLGSRTSLRLTDAAYYFEDCLHSPQFTRLPNLSLLTSSSVGVPENQEVARRTIAKNIMQHYPNFETIGFLQANGDLYLLEPYELKKMLLLRTSPSEITIGALLRVKNHTLAKSYALMLLVILWQPWQCQYSIQTTGH